MKSLAVGAIRRYQRWLSPLLAPSCRFQPTCSAYAIDAVETHGLVRGGLMTVWRLLRCNPFNDGGYDPAPPQARRLGRPAR